MTTLSPAVDRGRVYNCPSYWSICLDSDHNLLRSEVIFCHGGQPRRFHPKIDVVKFVDADIQSQFQGELSYALLISPPTGIDGCCCWHIRGALILDTSASSG